MSTLTFLRGWYALSLRRFRLPSGLPMLFSLWMVGLRVVIVRANVASVTPPAGNVWSIPPAACSTSAAPRTTSTADNLGPLSTADLQPVHVSVLRHAAAGGIPAAEIRSRRPAAGRVAER